MMHPDSSISSHPLTNEVQSELSQCKLIYLKKWLNLTFLCPHDRQSLDNGQPFLGEGELKPAVMSRHLSSIWSRWGCTTPSKCIRDYIMHTFDCSLVISRQLSCNLLLHAWLYYVQFCVKHGHQHALV